MFRIGFGSDTHRLEEGRELILASVAVPSDVGPVGHSDGDALYHAVTDAILGALALGDIGSHFPDTDPKWENADSETFVREAMRLASDMGYEVGNLDSVVNLEKPKLRPYIDQMRKSLSGVLRVGVGKISVKAKTGEGLDSVGTGRAIKAEACIILKKI